MKQPVEEEEGQTAAAITVHLVRWPGLIGPAARILQEDPPRSSDNGPCGARCVAPQHSSSSASSSSYSLFFLSFFSFFLFFLFSLGVARVHVHESWSPETQVTLRDDRQSEVWEQPGSLNMFNE